MSLRKVLVLLVGLLLCAAGVAALVLPGPGLLLLLIGLIVLATEFEWAERYVDVMRDKAFAVSAESVASWPRIIFSVLSALMVIVVGVFWWYDPQIPQFWVIGPDLPVGGWGTGVSIIVGGLIALALIGYSLKNFRHGTKEQPPLEG